jgi:transposase InsO family protein
MKEDYSLSLLCHVLEVSRSGYYRWLDQARGVRAQQTAQLDQRLREAFQDNRRAYGSPRLTVELREAGCPCSENRVAKRMRMLGLAARPRRRFVPRTTASDPDSPVAPNRKAEAPAPSGVNQIWVADLTYLPVLGGFVYLAAVMDLYSRRVIGWALAPNMERDLVMAALRQAIGHRQPAQGCLHHSDRGSQYASHDYRHLLREHGLEASMSRAGNCYDNAAMESFWSSLKAEGLQSTFGDAAAVRLAVFDYIETFYNPKRRHSALGYKSPVDFEHQMN